MWEVVLLSEGVEHVLQTSWVRYAKSELKQCHSGDDLKTKGPAVLDSQSIAPETLGGMNKDL
jgi:hypothetical protein